MFKFNKKIAVAALLIPLSIPVTHAEPQGPEIGPDSLIIQIIGSTGASISDSINPGPYRMQNGKMVPR